MTWVAAPTLNSSQSCGNCNCAWSNRRSSPRCPNVQPPVRPLISRVNSSRLNSTCGVLTTGSSRVRRRAVAVVPLGAQQVQAGEADLHGPDRRRLAGGVDRRTGDPVAGALLLLLLVLLLFGHAPTVARRRLGREPRP